MKYIRLSDGAIVKIVPNGDHFVITGPLDSSERPRRIMEEDIPKGYKPVPDARKK